MPPSMLLDQVAPRATIFAATRLQGRHATPLHTAIDKRTACNAQTSAQQSPWSCIEDTFVLGAQCAETHTFLTRQ